MYICPYMSINMGLKKYILDTKRVKEWVKKSVIYSLGTLDKGYI